MDAGGLAALFEPFMLRALAAALIVGVMSALLSSFLVLRGWSLMGDAIAHAVLPGLAIAALLGLPLAFGAFLSGLACATGAGALAAAGRVKPDAALGVAFSGLFALGLVIAAARPTGLDVIHVLLGNPLGVSNRDLLEMGAIAALVGGVVLARRRDLALWCFDEAHARAVGIRVGRLRLVFLALVAVSTVASLQAVGLVLSVALLIGPGATGLVLAKRPDALMRVAVASALLSAGGGVVLSLVLDGATGPCIVLVQAALFSLALAARAGWRRSRIAAPAEAL